MEVNMMKQREIKIKNAYSKLGMTVVLLFVLGCQEKTPVDNDKTSDSSISTHKPIPQKRKVQLFEVGNKNVPIAIVETHQGIYTKTHLLISRIQHLIRMRTTKEMISPFIRVCIKNIGIRTMIGT